jgi:predicted RNA-binding Zn ribbon-like protein
MSSSASPSRDLVLSFVATVRHDGDGGVADDLASAQDAATWVASVAGRTAVDDAMHARLLDLRQAVRSLFARTVAPRPASRADANRLLDLDVAVARVDAAAATLGPPRLTWGDDGPRVVRESASPEAGDRLLASLAVAAMDFLASDDATRLRACQAPRCVRYFLQDDPRQEWCKPSCGNRARVARYYERRKTEARAERS